MHRKTFAKRYEKAAPLWANSALELSKVKKTETAHCPVSFAHLSIIPRGIMIRVMVSGYSQDNHDEIRTRGILEYGADIGPKKAGQPAPELPKPRKPKKCKACNGAGEIPADRYEVYRCYDCKGANDDYMVKPETWHEAWPSYSELKMKLLRENPSNRYRAFLGLCFSCIEKRLDRPLTPEDFDLDLPINRNIALGLRMGLRTSRQLLENSLSQRGSNDCSCGYGSSCICAGSL